MENQINIGDQNTQQMNQKSPVQDTGKRKIGYLVIPTIISAIILILAGIFVFSMIKQNNEKSSGTQTPDTQAVIPTQPTVDLSSYKILLNYEERISDNAYTNGIYLLDPNTPPPKKIFDNPDYQTENNSQFINLKFTTDGKYLGWIKAGHQRGNSFEYGEISNSNIRRIQSIKANPSSYLETFSWSPNGQKFAILERVGESTESKYSYAVRIFDTKTTSQISEFQIAPTTRQHQVNFSWSRKDTLLAIFVIGYIPGEEKYKEVSEEYKVVSYTSNGNKEFEKVIHSVAVNSFRPIFDISQDGENIAFVKKFQSGNNYQGELWYGSIEDSNIQKLADTHVENCSNASPLTIAPDKGLIMVGSECADSVMAKIVKTNNSITFTAEVDAGSAVWSTDGKLVWVSEYVYSSSGQPLSQANYILDSQGKVVKKFDLYSPWVAWFPEPLSQ